MSTDTIEQPPTVDAIGESTASRRKKTWRRVISGVLVTLLLAALKLKALLLLIFTKFKALFVNPFEGFGLAQFAMTGGSMLVSLWAYAFQMGLFFAAGLISILLVHEIGHALVIRAKGLRAGAMVFIPFIGGAVTLKDQPRSAFDDAQIGLGGPIAGALGCLAFLSIYRLNQDPRFLAIAWAGFLINLLNLLPIGPLDGGRIAAAITKWMWVLGEFILIWLMFFTRNPFLLLIVIFGAVQIYRHVTRSGDEAFYSVTIGQRAWIATGYFLLVGFLALQTISTYGKLQQLIAR